MSLLPTSAEIIDLERSQAGTDYGNKGYGRQFLNRMRKCGYLDSTDTARAFVRLCFSVDRKTWFLDP